MTQGLAGAHCHRARVEGAGLLLGGAGALVPVVRLARYAGSRRCMPGRRQAWRVAARQGVHARVRVRVRVRVHVCCL